MSLVTRCTACGTLFKVVADQLKISDGWVRCGQCATVFDAQANLVAEPAPIAPSRPVQAQVSVAPPITASSFAASPFSTSSFATPSLAGSPADALDSKPFGQDSVRDSSSFNVQDRDALLAAFAPSAVSSISAQESELISLPPDSTPVALSRMQQATEPASSSGFSSGFSVPASPGVASRPQPAVLGSLRSDTRAGVRGQAPMAADSGLPSKAPSELESASFRPGALRNAGDLDSEAGPSTASWAPSQYPPPKDLRHAQNRSISVSAEPTTINTPPNSDIHASQILTTLPEMDSLGPSTTPSFVTQAKRAQRWRSPWVRLGLSLVVLTLLAGLALQVALHEKDRIAALRPAAKPWLDQLCQHMGCQVQALKQIESIAVDASSFNRINKNNPTLEAATQSYKLAVTLKNTGKLAVAIPHVELSLQDAQDAPILRRVLSPADLGASMPTLAPAQDLAGSITLQVNTSSLAGNRISGYRVLAFYP